MVFFFQCFTIIDFNESFRLTIPLAHTQPKQNVPVTHALVAGTLVRRNELHHSCGQLIVVRS